MSKQQQYAAQVLQNNMNNGNNYIQGQMMPDNQNNYHTNDDSLPPPPQVPGNNIINNCSVYSESHNYTNGNKINKTNIQIASLSKTNQTQSVNERPMLPPPPIPDHQISDLQQIQQQLIKKYDDISNKLNNEDDYAHENGNHNEFLPPPPSPPYFGAPPSNHQNGHGYNNNQHKQQNVILTMTQQINNLSIVQKSADNCDPIFDMPLPPPPLELQDNDFILSNIQPIAPSPNNNNTNNTNNNGIVPNGLPPPPPLPPLVESEGSSTSSLNNGHSNKNGTAKPQMEETRNTRSYLDDINKRRYVLKPTQSNPEEKSKKDSTIEENGRDTIQPFVNNSDVAAIIDFIRKFRPHVCDSSDDEENSDWDDN